MTIESGLEPPRRTKLHPPRLPNDVILRPRLFARLDRLATLSLIVAPASYGKTTFVSTWLEQISLPSAWLSLDDEDSEPTAFLSNVVSAIRTLFPSFGAGILERLRTFRQQSFDEIAIALANELNLLDHEFVLVLDDYHWIHDAAIHQLLIQLLTYPPQALHLVITARHDPPIPWNLRARSLFCELRMRDLSFTAAETAEFLAKAWNRPVELALAESLTEQLEGWVTGLRLAALNIDHERASTPSALVDMGRRSIADYFVAEIIKQLSGSTYKLLVRTSILDTLAGELCDYVTGNAQPEQRAADELRQLEARGIFITALDNEDAWYRLHPLFRSTLRLRLQETAASAEIAGLYERAVAWHEEQGLLEEAIRYALAGGQVAGAAAVVGRQRQRLLDEMDFHRLERWLRQFPPSAVDTHVDLLLTKTWLMYARAERPEIRACLDLIERLLATSTAEQQREWKGEVAALRSMASIYTGDGAAAVLAGQEALEWTPRDRFFVRTVATLHTCAALYMIGDSTAADSLLADAATDHWIARDLALLMVQHVRHYLQLLTADIETMCVEFPNLLQLTTARNMKLGIAWAHYYWGCASYLQNHLTSAGAHFHAVLDLADYAYENVYTHSAIGLALTLQAQAAPQEAIVVVEDLQRRLEAARCSQMLKTAKAFAAELAARQGRQADALYWLHEDARNLPIEATPMFYTPGLAAVRVLLAAGGDKELQAAQVWLNRVRKLAVQTRNIHQQIQVSALQAVVSDAGGDRPQALAALTQALALAERGRIVRVFIDLGRQLAPLLALPHSPAVSPGFFLEVCNAVETAQDVDLNADPNAYLGADQAVRLSARGVTAASNNLRELLTYREMDVLRLLDQRLTNKEIAHQLGISTETVRQHTIRLFRKLNVENRRQAIVTARFLGLGSDRE